MIKFGYTILYVKDVKKSLEFYENAFDFQRTFISPDGDYGELTTGNTILSFASVSLAKTNLKNGFIESDPNNKPFGIEVGFVTDAVEETIKKAVKGGATLLEKPKIKPWGQVVSYVRDPDGFLIEICSPMN